MPNRGHGTDYCSRCGVEFTTSMLRPVHIRVAGEDNVEAARAWHLTFVCRGCRRELSETFDKLLVREKC